MIGVAPAPATTPVPAGGDDMEIAAATAPAPASSPAPPAGQTQTAIPEATEHTPACNSSDPTPDEADTHVLPTAAEASTPDAAPEAPPTAAEEALITANEAAAIVTTTTTDAPTMTPAVPIAPSSPSLPPAAAPVTNGTNATVPAPSQPAPNGLLSTSPPSLYQIRSNGSSGILPGPGLKHAKPAVTKAVAKGKQPESNAGSGRQRPRTLLELPVDVLRLIVKEITHTNDLTALALANSTLYGLAIPHIYSRFDIVWPDPSAPASEGKSVDALTYGLSTLCLGSSFARVMHRLQNDLHRGTGPDATARPRSRFGTTDYAKYTRKFSLGNGPSEWVAEYMINKESGKMLGTLVSLCVAKMANLENFVWDMPTGVVSDVFMALASLPDLNPDGDCKLERLWIRWHDNSLSAPPETPTISPSTVVQQQQQTFVPQGSNLTSIGIMLPPHSAHPQPRSVIPYSSSHVEFPTFSVIPPLKSLTVLDIDELAYLDEMAILVERSKNRLTELRVGISPRAASKDFVQTWDGKNLQQVDLSARWPGESSIGDRRLGGVLGVLVGRVCDIRRRKAPKTRQGHSSTAVAGHPGSTSSPATQGQQATTASNGSAAQPEPGHVDSETAADLPPASGEDQPAAAMTGNVASEAMPNGDGTSDNAAIDAAVHAAANISVNTSVNTTVHGDTPSLPAIEDVNHASPVEESRYNQKPLEVKLKLKTLALERVPLSMQVCNRAIDWTTITALTLLDCPQHETLWKQLKRFYSPVSEDTGFGIAYSSARNAHTANHSTASLAKRYQLNLKSIHTDTVTNSLLSFIREVLAPNTLEVLFLQNRRRSDVPPTMATADIFKSAVKPHRSSLRKLLIDGSLRTNSTDGLENSHRRRPWTLNTDQLAYITSGRMANLRELSVSIYYQDWHTFLQRLPNLPQLRSLHIPHISDHVLPRVSPYDTAMQIADIVTLRPEVQLCFVGIGSKCYEVIESQGSDVSNRTGSNGNHGDEFGGGHPGAAHSTDGSIVGGTDSVTSDDDDDDDDDDDGDMDDDDSDDDGPQGINGTVAGEGAAVAGHGHGDSEGDGSDSGESDNDSYVDSDGPRLRMREIFFYDDKVAIFKARHGRL